jgi:hypothetical protein
VPKPANSFTSLTNYGVGIGLRVPHYQHILAKKGIVDWFEIISENFMVDGDRPLEVIDSILEQFCVVQRGVAIYFGSAEKLNREHLKRLKRLVIRTKTPWLSIYGRDGAFFSWGQASESARWIAAWGASFRANLGERFSGSGFVSLVRLLAAVRPDGTYAWMCVVSRLLGLFVVGEGKTPAGGHWGFVDWVCFNLRFWFMSDPT